MPRTEELLSLLKVKDDLVSLLDHYVDHARLLESRCTKAEEEAWILRQRWEEALAEVERLEIELYGRGERRPVFRTSKGVSRAERSHDETRSAVRDFDLGTSEVDPFMGP